MLFSRETFGENACHPERSEGSGSMDAEILRCAQDDSQDTSQARSREVLSPNVYSLESFMMLLSPETRDIRRNHDTQGLAAVHRDVGVLGHSVPVHQDRGART